MNAAGHPLLRYRLTVLEAWAVWTAFESGLFERLVEPRSAAALAGETGFDASALSPLLASLVVTGQLQRAADAYVVAPEQRRFLLRASPDYIGRSLGFLRSTSLFERYPELLRGGGALAPSDEEWERMTRGSAAYARTAVPALLARHGELRRGRRRILDIGCGQGDFLLALCDANPELACVGIDPTPAVATVARRRVAERPGIRIEALGIEALGHLGDIGPFDAIFLNHLLHVVGARAGAAILAHACRHLAADGALHVQELVLDGAEEVALFGLTLRVHFPDAQVFRVAELTTLLAQAGLAATDVLAIPGDTRGHVFVSGRRAPRSSPDPREEERQST